MKFGYTSSAITHFLITLLASRPSSGTDLPKHYFRNSESVSNNVNIIDSRAHLRRRTVVQTEIKIPLLGATYVKEDKPDNNYQERTSIEVDNDPTKKVSFLQFSIDCINGPVTKIELALPVKDPSNYGGKISTTDANLKLEDLNWNNAPDSDMDSVLIGRVSRGETKMINLPNSFLGNEPNSAFALRIDSESYDGADYYKSGIYLKIIYEGTPNDNCENPDPQTDVTIPLSRATFVKENAPGSNFEGSTLIEVDKEPVEKVSFLEFLIDCVNGPVTKIDLALPVKDPSDHGGIISTTDTAVDIGDLNWNNSPKKSTIDSVSIGRVRSEETKMINLPDTFLGNNPNKSFVLRIDAESPDGADYYKSGTYLKITFQGTADTSCEIPNLPNPRNEFTTISFAPSALTFIRQEYPDEEFYNGNTIEVDKYPFNEASFLKFHIECINGPIENVDLKLPVQNESDEGGIISKTDSNWNSQNLNWNNAPSGEDEYAAIGKVDAGTTKVVNILNHDLDEYDDKELSLRIDPESDNGAVYHKNGILLEVTYRGTLAPECEERPLPSDPSLPSNDYFQLKLFWDDDYYWQENKKEKRFCAYCKDECTDVKIKLLQCDYESDRQFWRWNDGKLESKKAPGYCMSYDGSAKNGKLLGMERCDSAAKFMGILTPPNENYFRWHPQGNNKLCVTNPHHPRDYEDLHFNPCDVALTDETAFWVTGTTWDSLGGYR